MYAGKVAKLKTVSYHQSSNWSWEASLREADNTRVRRIKYTGFGATKRAMPTLNSSASDTPRALRARGIVDIASSEEATFDNSRKAPLRVTSFVSWTK